MTRHSPQHIPRFPVDPAARRRARRAVLVLAATAGLLWTGLILTPLVASSDWFDMHPIPISGQPIARP